jgi:hypothetical protein
MQQGELLVRELRTKEQCYKSFAASTKRIRHEEGESREKKKVREQRDLLVHRGLREKKSTSQDSLFPFRPSLLVASFFSL